jgi:hypothetical protein
MHRTCDPASRSIPAGAARVLCVHLWGVVLCSALFEHCRGWCVVTHFDSPNDGPTGWPIPSNTDFRREVLKNSLVWNLKVPGHERSPVRSIPWALSNPRDQSVLVSVCLLKLQLPIRSYEQNVNYTHLFPLLVSGPTQFHSLNHTCRKSKLC